MNCFLYVCARRCTFLICILPLCFCPLCMGVKADRIYHGFRHMIVNYNIYTAHIFGVFCSVNPDRAGISILIPCTGNLVIASSIAFLVQLSDALRASPFLYGKKI